MLVLRYEDGKNPGKMSTRDEFKLVARSLAVASHQEGEQNFFILRGARRRQRPLKRTTSIRPGVAKSKLSRNIWIAGVILFIFGNLVGNPDTGSGGNQQHGTNHTKKNDTANIGGKSDSYRLFQANLDKREWERRNADIALHEASRQLESHRMELRQANQLTDEAQREKSWLFGEFDVRNKAFQEDCARDCL